MQEMLLLFLVSDFNAILETSTSINLTIILKILIISSLRKGGFDILRLPNLALCSSFCLDGSQREIIFASSMSCDIRMIEVERGGVLQ